MRTFLGGFESSADRNETCRLRSRAILKRFDTFGERFEPFMDRFDAFGER
jgi:hypothetical protein